MALESRRGEGVRDPRSLLPLTLAVLHILCWPWRMKSGTGRLHDGYVEDAMHARR